MRPQINMSCSGVGDWEQVGEGLNRVHPITFGPAQGRPLAHVPTGHQLDNDRRDALNVGGTAGS